MKIYGIKTCGSVKKAFDFFDGYNVSYDFIDLKKEKVSEDDLRLWLKYILIEKLINKQGTTYKKLALKDMNLDENGIKEWLLKEQMLFKRPIVVSDNLVTCGVDGFDKHLESL